MPGLNTTGLANTNDYNLGRGKIYIANLTNGVPDVDGYRDMGNAPEVNLSVETETLEHQSSRSGLKITDKEVTISQKVSLTFQLDEVNYQNLAQFFSGDAVAASLTNPAIAGVTNEPLVATVKLGRWYDLAGSGVRIYDIAKANLSVRRDPSGTPATLVQETDYLIDEKMGRVFFLTSPATVALVDGDEIDFTLTADAGANNPDEVRALTQSDVSVAVKFISENPANNGAQTEYQFHQISLKADGDLALISDEWTTMGFSGVAEANETADTDSPTLTIRTHAAA